MARFAACEQRSSRTSRSAKAIRIRMYHIGFGDCFLVSVPASGKTARILIDCGVHPQGDLGIVPEVVADIASVCDGHLDLVIATNANQDHISGFAQCETEFKRFSVGEVWLPWTENVRDTQAQGLKQKHVALADALRQHFVAKGMAVPGTLGGDAFAAVMNAAASPAALALLRSGINGGKVHYLQAGESFDEVTGIKGLSVNVLWPPRDSKFLARTDLPTGDRFFRLDGGRLVAPDKVLPFVEKWVAKSTPVGALREDEHERLRRLSDNSAALAFALYEATNDTSLAMLLSFCGKRLLFPGDAQYGSWASPMTSAAPPLVIDRLDFLKVAHHGSCYGTPMSIIETMPDGFVAMIPTQTRPWLSIPSEKLLNRLEDKASTLVRSDSIAITNAMQRPAFSLQREPHLTFGPFWCDCTIRL